MIAGLEEITDGIDLDRRRGHHRAAAATARHRDGVPELRALSAHERAAEPRFRAQRSPDTEVGDRAPGRRGGGIARSRGSPRSQARQALGRTAPARRDGAGDHPPAQGVPDGRAALESRRQAPGGDARLARRAARTPLRHERLRHPRPDRGDDARPARRGDARRADRPGRRAAAPVPGSGRRLRRVVHRLAVDEPRRRDRRRRRDPLRAVPRPPRPRPPAAAGRRPGDPGRPPGGVRERGIGSSPPAPYRRHGRRARGARLGRVRGLPRRRPAHHRRDARHARRRGDPPRRGRLSFHRTRRSRHDRPRRRPARARRRPVTLPFLRPGNRNGPPPLADARLRGPARVTCRCRRSTRARRTAGRRGRAARPGRSR